jgi:hypothetical protein
MADFDFTAINNATRNLPSGMKIAIAKGLLTSVVNTFERFDNELLGEAIKLKSDINLFQIKYKASVPNKG